MRSQRSHLATTLLVVAALAVDFAWLRHNITWSRSLVGLEAPAFDAGIMTMLTILLVVGRCCRPGRFKQGFAVAGFAWVAGYAWVARYRGDWVRAYVNPFVWGTAARLGADRHGVAIIYAIDLILFAVPQVALGFACGWLAKALLRRPVAGPTSPP